MKMAMKGFTDGEKRGYLVLSNYHGHFSFDNIGGIFTEEGDYLEVGERVGMGLALEKGKE